MKLAVSFNSVSVDLSPGLGAPRDQGRRPTCLAFATTAAHEHSRSARASGIEPLSEELLFWAATDRGRTGANGAIPAEIAKALKETGQPPYADCPYEETRDDSAGAYEMPPSARAPARLRRALMKSLSKDVKSVAAAVSSGQVVVAGIDLWPQFFEAHSGTLLTPRSEELIGDLHAVAVVAVDTDRRLFRIRNSWGSGWGEIGHATLPFDAWEIAAVESWVVSDEIDPHP